MKSHLPPIFYINRFRVLSPIFVRLFGTTGAREPSARPLEDLFGRFHSYLRVSVTERCNLRCKYCMPEEGVTLTPEERLFSLEEQKRSISLFAKLGVNKV